MEIDLTPLSANGVYHLMTQSLIPRPIAWVLTESATDNYNLAPFSYFTAISSAPPAIMLSIGKKPNGDIKDTVVNAKKNKYLVIHIASQEQAGDVTKSAATLAHGESELNLINQELCKFEDFPLPRLATCTVAFGCELIEIQEFGATPQSLVFAEVKRIYFDDNVVELDAKGRVKVNASKIKPLSRLGANQYASFGEIIEQARPK